MRIRPPVKAQKSKIGRKYSSLDTLYCKRSHPLKVHGLDDHVERCCYLQNSMLNTGYIDSQIKAIMLNGLQNSAQVVKYDEYGHYNVHHDGQPIASHSHLNCCHLNVTKVPSCRLCR